MQEEYLEMRGKELLIDGIVIAEVTNLEDAMAISDRVSNYVAELQRKIEQLEHRISLDQPYIRQLGGTPIFEHDEDICEQTGEPRTQCTCFECYPDKETYESEDDE